MELMFLAGILLLAAIVQGLSGLGFSLIAAPAATQAIPGSPAIGLVNLLALVQNIWQVWRGSGEIRWQIIRRLTPGLVLGFFVAVIPLYYLDNDVRALLVAFVSLGSLAMFVWWKPVAGSDSAFSAGAVGGAANTYAGVGGPIIAGFLKRQGWKRDDYLRTQQLIFAVMNVASIPLLGLPDVTPWQLLGAIALLPVGVGIGLAARRFVSAENALKVCELVVVIVGVVAVVRSIVQLSV